MELNKLWKVIGFSGILLLFFSLVAVESATLKVKVIVDNASVKETPEIGGRTLARVALNTILEAEEKQGEWYKIFVLREGVRISGYVHEIYVAVATGEELTAEVEKGLPVERTGDAAQVIAEIQGKLDANKLLIRQEMDFKRAIDALKPLIAKVFRISDNKQQKEIASELFLWMGLAYAKDGNAYAATLEFKNMFEVDYTYAKEIIRNIFDSEVVSLIKQAEREFLGLVTEYDLEILTEPKEAKIKIDGKMVGTTPEIYRTPEPQFVIEIEKEGFKPIKEDIFLTQPSSRKEYVLEMLGRIIEIKSSPSGANVFFDGSDTGLTTDCRMESVSFGVHALKLEKENYADWEGQIEVLQGEGVMTIELNLAGLNYEFVERWGGPLTHIFKRPTAIAVDAENNVYIADVSDVKIKKITSEGTLISTWGNGGREFKNIGRPGGLCVDRKGSIYVTDMQNHDVKKYSKDGKFMTKWGREGDKPTEFRSPMGIAVDQEDNIYILDSRNNRIKKYSPLGVVIKIWGQQGTLDGSFIFPAAIAVSQSNEIFVIDRSRIQKFSSDGEFMMSWGEQGSGEGQMVRPVGIFVDRDGYIYVADSGNNRIQKFDKEGKFIAKWGAIGKAEGQMDYPHDVAVDSNGYVFVVEKDNHRVQKFGVKSRRKQ